MQTAVSEKAQSRRNRLVGERALEDAIEMIYSNFAYNPIVVSYAKVSELHSAHAKNHKNMELWAIHSQDVQVH